MAPFVETVEDARLKGHHPATGRRSVVETTPDRRNVRIYCISCHCPGAFISSEHVDAVIYLCDQFSPCGHDCAGTKGQLTLPKLNI